MVVTCSARRKSKSHGALRLTEADLPAWEAAAYTGVTVKALEHNYGHRPTHQARARKALG